MLMEYYLIQGPRDSASNFYDSPMTITINGMTHTYMTLEHGIHHQKAVTLKDTSADLILKAPSPAKAKQLGDRLNNHSHISKWLDIDYGSQVASQQEISTCKAFRDRLQDMGQAPIYHSVRDHKWGIGLYTTDNRHPLRPTDITGLNLHGVLLMEIRYSPPVSDKEQSVIVPSASYAAATAVQQPPRANPSLSVTESNATKRNIYNKSNTPHSFRNPVNPRPKTSLIGNSLIDGVDPHRLSHQMEVKKTTAYTIHDAQQLDYTTHRNSELIILQLTTNDLKKTSLDQVVSDMKNLVDKIHATVPSSKISISSAPYQRSVDMNSKIKYVNASLELFYRNSSYLHVSTNDNINPAGDFYTRDGIHLNHRGSSMLAGNIRNIINHYLHFYPPGRSGRNMNLNRDQQRPEELTNIPRKL